MEEEEQKEMAVVVVVVVLVEVLVLVLLLLLLMVVDGKVVQMEEEVEGVGLSVLINAAMVSSTLVVVQAQRKFARGQHTPAPDGNLEQRAHM